MRLGNTQCDVACNTSACIWDQVRVRVRVRVRVSLKTLNCVWDQPTLTLALTLTLDLNQGDCGYTGEYAMEELCAVGCPVAWIDDGYCDEACYNDACRC